MCVERITSRVLGVGLAIIFTFGCRFQRLTAARDRIVCLEDQSRVDQVVQRVGDLGLVSPI